MFSLTPTQLKFIELDKKKAEYKRFVEEYEQTVKDLVTEMGVGGHFQDGEGTVYQTAPCDGKFIHFIRYEVNRTRRPGEKAGSLALKAAKDLGYSVE